MRFVAVAVFVLQTAANGIAQNSPPPADRPNGSPNTGVAPVPSTPKKQKQPYYRRFLEDELRIWTSPFKPTNYDSHTMKKYGVPFLLISGTLIATDRKTAEMLPNTTDQTVWSGRVSQLGAAYTLAGFSTATFLLGKGLDDDHAVEAGLLSLEALAHTQLVVFGLKRIFGRERPLVNNQHGSFWRGGDSFPSGHAATSFAVAAVFSYEYRDYIAVPILAYSTATAISLSRLSARRHWVSDIFVGGSMGFLIGRFVYKRHHNPDLPGSPVHNRRIAKLVPEIGLGMQGPELRWTF
jgi:membrane-associated phospholipid phosphatase